MKIYAYIFILLVFITLGGCRSHRSFSQTSERNTELQTKDQSTSNTQLQETTNSAVEKTTESNTQENAESISEATENKQVDEFEKKKEIKEEFDENGNIKSRTTTETERGRLERSDSRAGTHDASNRSESSVGNEKRQESIETKIDQLTESNSESNLHEQEKANLDDESNTDSRWIQGSEWLYVIIPIAIICGVIYWLSKWKDETQIR